MNVTELLSSKETDNKLRWDSWVYEPNDGRVLFALYIPKWRIPKPWPRQITLYLDMVTGRTDKRLHSMNDASEPDLNRDAIVVEVLQTELHKTTIQYSPGGDQLSWEIGSIYIPKSLTCGAAERLRVRVEWNMNETGRFERQIRDHWS